MPYQLVSLELKKAQESLLLNEDLIEGIKATSKTLKEESDEKIRVMETALDEEKLKTQIPNDMSTMTQTGPRDPDEKYLEQVTEQTYAK